jgi:hypothetical protein
MEVIKPVKSMLNGNLAFKEGDWNFSKPCHWYFSKKLLKPIPNIYIPPERTYIRNLANRETDKEVGFRPGKRMFECRDKLPTWVVPPTGCRKIIPKYTQPIYHKPHINHSPHAIAPNKTRCIRQFPQKWQKHSFGDDNAFEDLKHRHLSLAKTGLNVINDCDKILSKPQYAIESYNLTYSKAKTHNNSLTRSLETNIDRYGGIIELPEINENRLRNSEILYSGMNEQ